MMNITIPVDVPSSKRDQFTQNYHNITRSTGKLFLFSGDQRIEHFMKDFYGQAMPPESSDPSYLFTIAEKAQVGAFATHLGLIARYGQAFPSLHYIIKLNAKTDLIPTDKQDPLSRALWTIDNIVSFKKESGLSIAGVGYTVYLGSQYESEMLREATSLIYQAHQQGLVTILWLYPRGAQIPNERDPKIIAGAAGVAPVLGADFAKINPPQTAQGIPNPELLRLAVAMAGNTKLICSGGKTVDAEQFLRTIYEQLTLGGVSGCAVGRNIYQRPLTQAIATARAIAALMYEDATFEKARTLLR
jgi:fructose-bisphosphate aldolase / 6-deoxy-5-ketofructose 1-phosphate synthase